MLHGLLLVLKIAGIILAVLLGIVLAAAAAVLFVPVRYAADAQYDKNSGKKPVLHVRVTWLLHLFRFFMEYNEGFKMRAQVLFFPMKAGYVHPAPQAGLADQAAKAAPVLPVKLVIL